MMERLQRAALLVALAEKLRESGSWCGETHIQKGMYFLQSMLELPTGYKFILYKYGPFSFDLRDELAALCADGVLALKLRPAPYGPSLEPTNVGVEVKERYPITVRRYSKKLGFVARHFGAKGVTDLECLATALYVTGEAPDGAAVDVRADSVRKLKPHVPPEKAVASVQALDGIREEAAALC